MPPEPVPAEPEWDDDPAWSRPDPMTAAEREACPGPAAARKTSHPSWRSTRITSPLTAAELAEIEEAAADELLAVKAATTGRRGPGQPGSARVFPGESASPAAGFGPGMALDVLPGCAGLAVAADAACGGEDAVRRGVRGRAGRPRVRLGPGSRRTPRARKLAAIAELARRDPGPGGRGVHRRSSWPAPWASPAAAPATCSASRDSLGHPAARHRARRCWTGSISRYKAEIIAPATALLDPDEARAAEPRCWTGPPATGALTAPRSPWRRPTAPANSPGCGPVDPWLARDLATAAARNPSPPWCVTVTDEHGHAIGHGCARGPNPRAHRPTRRARPPAGRGPGSPSPRPAGTGRPADTAPGRCAPPGPGPDLIVTLDSLTTDPCDHRYESSRHDPGVKLRHLSQIRHATCTSPVCRRPAAQCDHEHNTPYEAGGRTCLCNTGPKCRHDHRLKQHPSGTVDQLPDGTFRWTAPSGRTYTTEPTRYPI